MSVSIVIRSLSAQYYLDAFNGVMKSIKIDAALEANWNRVLDLVRNEIAHEGFFNDYVKKMKIVRKNDNRLYVNANSLFAKSVVLDNYRLVFNEACSSVFGEPIEVIFLSEEEEKIFLWSDNQQQQKNFNNEQNTNIKKNYTFDTFVVGSHNQQAFSAAKTVLEETPPPWNPVFIYGNTGLGKTHLLFAIGNEFLKKHYDKNVLYIEANEYTQKVINAISNGNSAVDILKNQFKKLDLLLIDDIQFLATREKTNEIFFDIFNALYNSNKIIILTSDKPPEKLDGFAERMISRFASGLTVKIDPPDLSTLEVIVEKKLNGMNLVGFFEKDAIRLLTNLYGNDIRKMNGALNSISFYLKTQANLNPNTKLKPVTEKVIEKLLSEQNVIRNVNPTYDPEIIIERICLSHRVNVDDLKSRKRNLEIVNIRQICMYILYKKLHLNLTQIGKLLRRDHSTVLSSIKKVEKEIQTKETIRDYIENEKWKK